MERQAEQHDRRRGLAAALLILVPMALAGCVQERPAYVVDPDRSESAYEASYSRYTPDSARRTYPVVVRDGDSIAKIAERCNTTVEEIAALNDLNDRYPLYPGEVLRAPHPPREETASVPLPIPRPHRVAQPHYDRYADARPAPRPRPYRDTDYDAPADTQPARDEGQSWWSWWTKPASDEAPAETARFSWPVRGRVIEGFGRGDHGERNDGINIATEYGAPIRAAASGTVTYTGNELKGYGNLVLIRHSDGFVTAYAHAGSIRVARGEHVERGQVIGTAGETGDVDEPQLHFEIRRGVQAVDPERYLTSGRAS